MVKKEIITELSRRVYGNTSISALKLCSQFFDTLIDICRDSLINDGKVSFKGLMTMEVIERGPRKGRNPKTNEVEVFPPSKHISCKVSKNLKMLVKENGGTYR